MIFVQHQPTVFSQSNSRLWVAVKLEDSTQFLHSHDAKTICKAMQRKRDLIQSTIDPFALRLHPFVKEELPHEYARVYP